MTSFTRLPQTTDEENEILSRFNDFFTGEHDRILFQFDNQDTLQD